MNPSDAGLPHGKMPVIRVPSMPAHTNPHGTIFGGWVMSQVDMAGSIPAAERARGPVVTVAVDSFEFKKPVFVGDLVSCYADIIKVGRTSITVLVDVYAQRSRDGETENIKVTEATLVYVAVDETGQPRPIPVA